MTSISQELWDEIVAERGPQCEMCHWNLGTELHHCIVKRKKGCPDRDVAANLMLLCRTCHSDGYVNSHQCAVGFWGRQVERGYKMQEWYDGLKLKTREHFG